MKAIIYFFTGMTALGLFFLVAGLAGSHGHFRFRPERGEDWIMFGVPLLGIAGLLFIWMMRDNVYRDTVQSKIRGSIEYEELMTALYLAIEKLESLERRRSALDASVAELRDRLTKARTDLHLSNFTVLQTLWTWFAPTGIWDDTVGEDGIELGNKIFQLIEKLRSMR